MRIQRRVLRAEKEKFLKEKKTSKSTTQRDYKVVRNKN